MTAWEYDLGQIIAFGQLMFVPHLKMCKNIKHILMVKMVCKDFISQ